MLASVTPISSYLVFSAPLLPIRHDAFCELAIKYQNILARKVRCKESPMNSVKIVEDFWTAVWKSRNPDAIANFVVEDVVITTGGIAIKGRDKFIAWAWDFLSKINDLNFEVLETFQNEDGSRVASLWRVTGKNNGMMGTVPDQQPVSLTGTAIWSVREDGKLLHNRVERAAWETFLNLTSKSTDTRNNKPSIE
jgi:hypothetical protein